MTRLNHVAIIMDGNGRWAKRRFRPRIWGHVRGSSVVSEIVEAADEIGVKSLTLYAFSTENWSRPLEEVTSLFKILRKFLKKEKDRIVANNIKFKVIGEISNLPQDTINLIKEVENDTKNATGLNLTFAFSYGGRAEIIRSVNSFIQSNPGQLMADEDLATHLYRPECGDVDLLIRTGGEQRISNFLLWQIAYAEMFFTPTMWPDFTSLEFKNIIDTVLGRERRFGNISSVEALEVANKQALENKEHYSSREKNLNV